MAQINKPSEYFNTKLYTGNGSTNAITGVGHQPDLVWIKRRDAATSNEVYDAVRTATYRIKTDATSAQDSDPSFLTAFDSDGFTLGSHGGINNSGSTFVSWNWKANGSGVSNTDGSITSTVSASTTSGFSIVKWTSGGSTQVGHGLGVSPNLVIMKSTSSADNWVVGSSALGWTNRLRLNTTDASSSSGAFQNTDPTSLIFYENYSASSCDKIAYCFAEKKGFSKFMGWSGNGSTDGTFLYTGFKPALFIYKVASGTTGGWGILDNKRDTFNPVDNTLVANSSNAEADDHDVDFLSNGLKIRSAGGNINMSGATYIGMAFAEEPLVSSNGVPNTAR